MIDAGQWAKRIRQARIDATARDSQIEAGFLERTEAIAREAQLDTINQALRVAHDVMRETPPRHRAAVGIVVDRLSDLALDVKRRQTPNAGG